MTANLIVDLLVRFESRTQWRRGPKTFRASTWYRDYAAFQLAGFFTEQDVIWLKTEITALCEHCGWTEIKFTPFTAASTSVGVTIHRSPAIDQEATPMPVR